MPQNERRAFGGRQALHRHGVRRADFAAQQGALGIGGVGGHLHGFLLGIVLFPVPVVRVDAALVDPIQRAVHRDPVDPGSESGAELKAGQPLIPAQKGLLHNLLRIGFIADNAKRHSEDSGTMGTHKRAIRFLVPGQYGPDNGVIVSVHSAH